MSEETISLGTYLFERLHQEPIGLRSIFGVPGDFNLTLLDKIDDVKGLSWKGNANELNAAYSADGYSRVKGGIEQNSEKGGSGFAALVTTFGVGELSALNGIAGAYAEHVGLLHIVGIPSIAAQSKQLLLHHTLGNGDFTVFRKMSSFISQTTGFLSDPATAAGEIDRCIREAYINQRPSYLAFPSNMVEVEVPRSLLDTPIDVSIPKNEESEEDEVIERTLELIKSAKNPIILIDACCARHNSTLEASKLIELTNFRFALTPMAKGSKYIDEAHPNFTGIYVGSLSYPKVKEAVESSDLVLSLGAMLSDFNTGSFSYSYSTKNVVEFHSNYIKIRSAQYPNVRMKQTLQRLLKSSELKEAVKGFKPTAVVKDPFEVPEPGQKSISQQWLWYHLGEFLQKGDVIITETGTSSFGIVQTPYPPDALGISQVLWGSIGYSVGALFGAVTAAEEFSSRRTILFVGDGSLQLTVQEISSMIRNKNKPYIFVLNNDGYTIERLIHGENAGYNDIQPWKHQELLNTFGATDFESIKVSTLDEISKLFKDKDFAKADKIRLIEIMLPKMDAPQSLIKQAELSAKTNSE
ncbi:pyruvate decarboxylase [Yamadazyma tenuis ATCC 10573]|uniref:Pyruvate decarboxylase n=2 Tax=Candida tenuis TaxID=2315449 RepID=G3BFJ7_CANTC|nr:pyruvate decarboxylase [Yamadazyma tenuis ATCC 10573]EGV60034.1 pyruvate decarboxylase [Yamadazyma tenuis ATCC 10573]